MTLPLPQRACLKAKTDSRRTAIARICLARFPRIDSGENHADRVGRLQQGSELIDGLKPQWRWRCALGAGTSLTT
jgi:hypothetical protein